MHNYLWCKVAVISSPRYTLTMTRWRNNGYMFPDFQGGWTHENIWGANFLGGLEVSGCHVYDLFYKVFYLFIVLNCRATTSHVKDQQKQYLTIQSLLIIFYSLLTLRGSKCFLSQSTVTLRLTQICYWTTNILQIGR